MTGFGLNVDNCDNVLITNCSYYYSTTNSTRARGGVHLFYNDISPSENSNYTLELSHSNMTNCSAYKGGGILLQTQPGFRSAIFLLSHLVLLRNRVISDGAGLAIYLNGGSNELVELNISDCSILQGKALHNSGGLQIVTWAQSTINILRTDFYEKFSPLVSELAVHCINTASLLLLNSNIQHQHVHPHKIKSNYGLNIIGSCTPMKITNTKMIFAALSLKGLYVKCQIKSRCILLMDNCQIVKSHNVPSIIHLHQTGATIIYLQTPNFPTITTVSQSLQSTSHIKHCTTTPS